jgi:hypothetical protein
MAIIALALLFIPWWGWALAAWLGLISLFIHPNRPDRSSG